MRIGNVKHYLGWLLILLCLAQSSCKSSEDDEITTTVEDQDEDATTQTINNSYVYKLPVIFHVLYSEANNETQYVSATRLKIILSRINELYQGNVYGESENINVKFELAKYDEKGNKLATPGVEYVKWTGEYPIDATEFMSDQTGKNVKYIWDPNEYINVMMFNFKSPDDSSSELLGISNMPLTVKGDSSLSGLEEINISSIKKSQLQYAYCSSINSKYINSESTRYTNKGKSSYQYQSTDINVTLAHELGHYLGLHHVFAETKKQNGYDYAETCFDSDYCKDTPSYNRKEYNDYLYYYLSQHSTGSSIDINDLTKRTNCDGETFESANILDYAVGLGYKISADQKYRIRHVLYNSPLIPGPKVSQGTRSASTDKELNLPITIVK